MSVYYNNKLIAGKGTGTSIVNNTTVINSDTYTSTIDWDHPHSYTLGTPVPFDGYIIGWAKTNKDCSVKFYANGQLAANQQYCGSSNSTDEIAGTANFPVAYNDTVSIVVSKIDSCTLDQQTTDTLHDSETDTIDQNEDDLSVKINWKLYPLKKADKTFDDRFILTPNSKIKRIFTMTSADSRYSEQFVTVERDGLLIVRCDGADALECGCGVVQVVTDNGTKFTIFSSDRGKGVAEDNAAFPVKKGTQLCYWKSYHKNQGYSSTLSYKFSLTGDLVYNESNEYENITTLGDIAVYNDLPIGSIVAFTDTASEVTDYLKCDGSTYSKELFPDLWKILKTSDSSTTFTVPDLRDGRFLEGSQDSAVRQLKDAGLPQIPASGNLSINATITNAADSATAGNYVKTTNTSASSTTASAITVSGGNHRHTGGVYGKIEDDIVLPKSYTVSYYIKAKKEYPNIFTGSVIDGTKCAIVDQGDFTVTTNVAYWDKTKYTTAKSIEYTALNDCYLAINTWGFEIEGWGDSKKDYLDVYVNNAIVGKLVDNWQHEKNTDETHQDSASIAIPVKMGSVIKIMGDGSYNLIGTSTAQGSTPTTDAYLTITEFKLNSLAPLVALPDWDVSKAIVLNDNESFTYSVNSNNAWSASSNLMTAPANGYVVCDYIGTSWTAVRNLSIDMSTTVQCNNISLFRQTIYRKDKDLVDIAVQCFPVSKGDKLIRTIYTTFASSITLTDALKSAVEKTVKIKFYPLKSELIVSNSSSTNASDSYVVNSWHGYWAPEYDSTRTYVVGLQVMHDDKFYKCKTAIYTAEDWTETKWTEITDNEQKNYLWYRMYSDGFCELGGILTTYGEKEILDLLIPYMNMVYCTNAKFNGNVSYTDTTSFDAGLMNLTIYHTSVSNKKLSWTTSGWISDDDIITIIPTSYPYTYTMTAEDFSEDKTSGYIYISAITVKRTIKHYYRTIAIKKNGVTVAYRTAGYLGDQILPAYYAMASIGDVFEIIEVITHS